jgi:SAM-dependent methyltransferase
MSAKPSSNESIRSTIAYYDEHAGEFVRRTRDVDMSKTRQAFTSCVPPHGRILDAGCGSGRDAVAFLQEGFSVTAFDGSAAMADLASASTGLRVLQLTFEDVGFKSQFDGVWACASLLHLPPDHLDDAVERLISALKPDGVLFMSFKDGHGVATEKGRFTALMSTSDLEQLLARHSRLILLHVWTTDDAEGRSLSWINVLARRRSAGDGAADAL